MNKPKTKCEDAQTPLVLTKLLLPQHGLQHGAKVGVAQPLRARLDVELVRSSGDGQRLLGGVAVFCLGGCCVECVFG